MGAMEGQLCQRVQKMVEPGLVVKIILKKQPMAEEWKERYRQTMKRNFDERHRSEIPDVQTGSTALGRKGLD